MRTKMKLYSIIIICGIIIGILVPFLFLTGRQADTTPPIINIISPTNKTYISQSTQLMINFTVSDPNLDIIWYRIYNETNGVWVDSSNLTWSSPFQRSLGQGGVYTLYVWANDTYGHTSTESVVFTMIHEILMTGDHMLSTDLVVTLYQKVIFQDGEFTFIAGNLVVLGTLEMYNVTFHGNLTAEGVVILENVTVNSQLIFTGNSTATLQNSQIDCNITANNNALVSISNSGITSLISFMNALISVEDCWANSLVLDGNSSISANNLSAAILITHRKVIASLTLLNISGISYLYDNSNITLRNATIADSLFVYDNVTLTIENSQIDSNITANYNAIVSIANSGIATLISFMNALISVENCWADSLILDGDSSISVNTLSAASLITLNKLVASLTLLYISGMSYLYHNSDITFRNATFADKFYVYHNVTLTIEKHRIYQQMM